MECVAFVKPLYFGLKFAYHYNTRELSWMKKDIVRMGPAYVKIGQFVATRTDVFPRYVTEELSDLYDNTTPVEYDIVHQLLIRENAADIFETIDTIPLSTASVGQVHRATLKTHPDVQVVFKIQKPNVREAFETDFDALDKGIRMLMSMAPGARVLKDMHDIVVQSRRSVFQELDFKNERQNLLRMRRAFENTNVRVPRVIGAVSTSTLLVMEYVDARRVRVGDNMNELTKEVVIAGMKHGIVHGDLHPGNVGVSGSQFVLFDCGAVIRFEPKLIKALFSCFISKNKDSIVKTLLSNNLVYIDQEPRGRAQLERAIEYVVMYVDEVDIKRFFSRIKSDPLLGQSRIDFRIDPDMLLLSRTISLLEGTCKEYQANFNYNDIIVSMLSDIDVLTQYIDVDAIIQRGLSDMFPNPTTVTDHSVPEQQPDTMFKMVVLIWFIEILLRVF